MAEMFIGPIIEKLAVEPLMGEARALTEIHREAESLKNELQLIHPLLTDADHKSRRTPNLAVAAWMNQIRRAAIRSEIVVDEYRLLITNRRPGFLGLVRSWKSRRHVASNIREAKRCLAEIRERGQGYGLKPSPEDRTASASNGEEGRHVDPRLGSLFLEDEEVVGIESKKGDLVEKLVGGSTELAAVWIVGEGGIGKTTLAKRVFDDEAVTRRFETARAWITVSQPYDLKKVAKAMKVKMCSAVGEGDTLEDLIGCLRHCLRTKRYVIVFDDVWEERFWGDIKLALPNNNHGSRVLITTRNEKVYDSCKDTPHFVERLQPWSVPLAWELFCKKAFRYKLQGNCPDELKKLSKKIVIKCQGLPLVITTVAGILAEKETSMSEWENVLGDLTCTTASSNNNNSELTRVHEILSLSYYDLPDSLKPCLLYFCMFPEDYSVSDDRLYRLWVAEGFVKAKGNKAAEDVAEEYMSELVRRNLVVFMPWRIVGIGNHFRVHDLMRDVIIAKAEELGFCRSWSTMTSKFVGYGRRLTISEDTSYPLEKLESFEIRSLIISDELSDSPMRSYFKKFKFLMVMDAQLSSIQSLPKELGKMSHLKYLSLKNSNVKSLPKSIGKLYNLYSLDVRETLIVSLPEEINKLKNLRHILADNRYIDPKSGFKSIVGVQFPEGFGELEELQTLTWVDSHLGGSSVFKELNKLKKLRWLNIDRLKMEFMVDLCNAIDKMHHLQRLFIRLIGENNVLNLQHISSPPLTLRDLIMVGQLDKLPTWILELRNLRGLCLSLSDLVTFEAMESLKILPNLETLQMGHNACQGHELRFEVGGFLKLKRLSLIGLENLKEVRIERGALSVLERLVISECSMLDALPSLHHLENIKEVTLNGKRIF